MTNSDKENIWENFGNTLSPENDLVEKVKLLAFSIVLTAGKSTETLLSSFKKEAKKIQVELDDSKFNQIFFEVIIFYLHNTDRIAFNFLPIEKKDLIMKALILSVEEETKKIDKGGFKLSLTDTFNERQEEYGKYSLSIPKEGGLGGTLFWEFGKKIAFTAGYEENVLAVMYVQECIINSISVFQLPNFFKSLEQ